MEFQSKPGRLWAENEEGKLIAEITFPEAVSNTQLTLPTNSRV